jgi:hypothetical protein
VEWMALAIVLITFIRWNPLMSLTTAHYICTPQYVLIGWIKEYLHEAQIFEFA